MLELPEAMTIVSQINNTIRGKKISNVIALHTPHKFAWFNGDPNNYDKILSGKNVDDAGAYGGMVEIKAGDAVVIFGDGVVLRYHDRNENRPQKHQLLIEFEDTSAISASVQMYGGLYCSKNGEFDNPYYKVAKEKPSPLCDEFNEAYFESMISLQEYQKLSAKAFLATEQRIPGLGNGVLQDILWYSKIHPKRKINTLSQSEQELLFKSVKTVLKDMTDLGGRDTEKDFFGNNGGYKTKMSKVKVGLPCMACGGSIKKESYLGGSIYFCEGCQKIW